METKSAATKKDGKRAVDNGHDDLRERERET